MMSHISSILELRHSANPAGACPGIVHRPPRPDAESVVESILEILGGEGLPNVMVGGGRESFDSRCRSCSLSRGQLQELDPVGTVEIDHAEQKVVLGDGGQQRGRAS
jgi:hypothetical protein